MNRLIIGVLSLFITLGIISDSFYILDQRRTALVTQFGESVRYVVDPGLKFKIPLIQNILFFDKRIQNLVADTTEVIASDQKTMRVDAFTKYRIVDGLKFYQTAKDDRGFKTRLAPILDSSLRQVLGSRAFITLLTPERAKIMLQIREIVATQAKDFGVEVVDVRIMRADLPDKSREAVYDRMKSEREKEAKEIRAEGAEAAQKITASAEREKQIILADANKLSQIARGNGDAEAIRLFSTAFNKDPEFFDFYRTLQAYKKVISKDDTKMIISDSEFLKHFKKN
ncbi:MAG: protease modulator HflC [Candidatus Jidaibacter sp.]|jgi:membrane protease subunit HflC|nr:protease modulator HflC [Candidatus Jidaibacter sp.]